MECLDYLPLGSIVVVRGNGKRLMIISRAVAVPQGDTMCYVDYGGCFYPEGMMSDAVFYFNHDDIQQVVFQGYRDKENTEMLEILRKAMNYVTLEKAVPKPLEKEDIDRVVAQSVGGAGAASVEDD